MPYFTASDDVKLWYDLMGEGTPLVVLPGGPGIDVRYMGDIGGLHRYRQLVLLDARGAGRSQTPGDRSTISFTKQARDVEALRLHLGLERFDLLAHSAGCLTAQEYAAAYPGRIRRAVLVTPVGRAGREPDAAELARLHASRANEPWYADAAEAPRLAAEGNSGIDPNELQRRLRPFYWYRWTEQRHEEHQPGHACRHPWFRQAFYADSADPDTLPDRLARLAGSGLRPLVLAGAADGMIGVAPARAVAACHPGSRLELLERSGHRVWVEEPERFRTLVTEFLNA
jgi:proline iminopeptidase